MKKVVVAIDGSEVSKNVIDYALHYAEREKDVELFFLHVLAPADEGTMSFKGYSAYVPPPEDEVKKSFRKFVQDQIKMMGEAKLHMTVQVVTGTPYDRILAFAEEKNADMIMIGHRGLSNVERFFLGSVAAKVVEHARCSVYVHRPKPEAE